MPHNNVTQKSTILKAIHRASAQLRGLYGLSDPLPPPKRMRVDARKSVEEIFESEYFAFRNTFLVMQSVHRLVFEQWRLDANKPGFDTAFQANLQIYKRNLEEEEQVFSVGFLYQKYGSGVDTKRELKDEELKEMRGSFTYANQFSARLNMIQVLTRANFVSDILEFQKRYENMGVYLTRLNALKLKFDMKNAEGKGYDELNSVLIELRKQVSEFEN